MIVAEIHASVPEENKSERNSNGLLPTPIPSPQARTDPLWHGTIISYRPYQRTTLLVSIPYWNIRVSHLFCGVVRLLRRDGNFWAEALKQAICNTTTKDYVFVIETLLTTHGDPSTVPSTYSTHTTKMIPFFPAKKTNWSHIYSVHILNTPYIWK